MNLHSRVERLELAAREMAGADAEAVCEAVAINELCETMDAAHAAHVMEQIADEEAEVWSGLTHRFVAMVERRTTTPNDPRPFALPPGVAQIFLDDPRASTAQGWDCEACGYEVPSVKSMSPMQRVWDGYNYIAFWSPDGVYFASCPLCGSAVGQMAWLAGRSYQSRLEEAAAAKRGSYEFN
jgi:hypothetical protein